MKTLIYENSFTGSNDKLFGEGTGTFEVKDGKLFIDAAGGVMTVWIRDIFHGDLHITYEASITEPVASNNINFFFYATVKDGESILTQSRTGAYNEYHESVNTYIMTFVGDETGAEVLKYTRLRKDPGFHLLSENTDIYPVTGEKYIFEIEKTGTRIGCKINGITVHDYTDPFPYDKGSVGFRTYNTKLWYSNLKIYGEK